MSLATIERHADIVVPDATTLTRPEWLKIRRQGIGGSDAAAALGLSKWSSPYSLWTEKTSDTEPVEITNQAMTWGNRLEEAIGHGFAEDTGIPVMRYPAMLRSKQWPWMMVNLDFITADGLAVVECKNVGLRAADQWENDQVPIHYAVQVQHEMAVTGMDSAWLAVLIGGQDPRYIRVERDETVIADMAAKLEAFWHSVTTGTPPTVDESEATKEALALRFPIATPGSSVELDVRALDLLSIRANLKADIKEINGTLTGVENELRELLGDAEAGTFNGTTVVTYKTVTKAPYTVTPKPYRTFHIPKGTK